ALVYGVITLSILFIAGIRWQYFVTLIGAIVTVILGVLVIALVGAGAWFFVLKPKPKEGAEKKPELGTVMAVDGGYCSVG
ncbi:MAG: hypothetical protein ACLGHY_14120, partial [Gammaproteobacteria bacterium]